MLGSHAETVFFGRFGKSLDTWTIVYIRGQGVDISTIVDS